MEQKINKKNVFLRIFENVWISNTLKIIVLFLLFDLLLSLNTVSNRILKSTTENTSENFFYSSNYQLNKVSASEIDQLVSRVELISAIQVSIFEFQQNRREIIYTSIDSKELTDIYTQGSSIRIPYSPIFTNNNSDNQYIISLIYGDFVCRPFDRDSGFDLVPEAEFYVSTVCSVSFPPDFGKFVGVISIYTDKIPTEKEAAQLRILAKDLSRVIHGRPLHRM